MIISPCALQLVRLSGEGHSCPPTPAPYMTGMPSTLGLYHTLNLKASKVSDKVCGYSPLCTKTGNQSELNLRSFLLSLCMFPLPGGCNREESHLAFGS
jgi:hypothetical protein